MTCNQAMEQMSAMLDGMLSPTQCAELQAHLDACPDCRRLMQTMQGLEQKVSSLREPAPEGLKRGVLYRIDQATGKAKPVKRRRFGPGTAFGAIAAVLVLLVGTGVIPLARQTRDTAPTPTGYVAGTLPMLDQNTVLLPATTEPLTGGDFQMEASAPASTDGVKTPMGVGSQPTTTAAPDNDYYISGGDSDQRRSENPVDEATRAACANLSSERNAMVLLYTEFDYESLSALLEAEEPKLYAAIDGAEAEQQNGLLCYQTTCGTALAIQEWLLENLPQSEQISARAREAETALMIRMAQLDPESGSLYRIITWAPRSHPIQWPKEWPEGWAIRLRTEENWGLFFPTEGYLPVSEQPACLVFSCGSSQ